MKKQYLIVGGILILLCLFINKLDNDFIESCIESGYDKDYCEMEK